MGELLRRDWLDLVDGIDDEAAQALRRIGVEVGDGEEPPCPACGAAAQLVAGACSECGLQLE